MTSDTFLLSGRLRRWQWPWALLGTTLTVVLAFAFGMAGSLIEERVASGFGRTSDQSELKPGQIEAYVGFATFGVALVAAPALVLWIVHRQNPLRALSPMARFDWGHFGKAALAYLAMLLVLTALALARDPSDVRVMERGFDHVPWLVLAALVILPQAFGEDYLFKGYLARVWGAVVPIRILVIASIAVLFAAAHGLNEDVRTDLVFNLVQFVVSEMIVLWLFVRTGSLALTTGLHWMNNVWAFCIVSVEPGQPDTLSLFRAVDRIVLAGGTKLTDPWSWAAILLGYAILVVLIVWPRSPCHVPEYRPDAAGGDQRG